MSRLPILLGLLLLSLFATGCQRSRSAAPFNCVGHWRVADGSGQSFYITLKEDYTASSTLAHHGEGTWSVDQYNVRIVWQNRWVDFLVVNDTGVGRIGCAPGGTIDDIPENSSTAERVDRAPGY